LPRYMVPYYIVVAVYDKNQFTNLRVLPLVWVYLPIIPHYFKWITICYPWLHFG